MTSYLVATFFLLQRRYLLQKKKHLGTSEKMEILQANIQKRPKNTHTELETITGKQIPS